MMARVTVGMLDERERLLREARALLAAIAEVIR
mgnify:CR=1 FL=1